jgi:peptidoglycan/xylan/chitin deacetylase (PgdA/CDA1 family)
MTQHRPLIFMYHSLDPSGSVISTSPDTFRAQIEFLAASGVAVVPLDAVRHTPGAVALTFDDGYQNFREHALPILWRHRMPATVFVVSGYSGRKNDWPSQPAGIPTLDLMSWADLRDLTRYGISLGAHTVNHPHLTSIPEHHVDEEFSRCRAEIEERTGTAVNTVAYPYGEANPAVRLCARKHFRLGCGTVLAEIPPVTDPAELPRIDTYYLRSRFWFESVVKGRGWLYLLARRRLRAARQIFLS